LVAGGDALSQGRKREPESALFVPSHELYAHIPKRHFYEQLDSLLDLSFVYELTRPLYAEKMGRPSLDPVVFFKCMLVGFFENVVYDRELEFRIADSLTLRKFLGYSLEERTPDESTLRKTRGKMPEESFRAVFDYVLDVCKSRGLLKGRAIGTDSTLVDANAAMDSLEHRELGCSYEEYVLAVRRQDKPDASAGEAALADKGRVGKASNKDWRSATDPQSRVMQHADGHTHLSYKVDASVDLETGVIVSAGAELADVSDQGDFLERVDEARQALEERGLELGSVVADKGHECGENLVGLEERGLVGLISSRNQYSGKPRFRREDFSYDSETDTLVCPAGQRLAKVASKDRKAHHYKASGNVCKACPNFGICTRSKNGRSVMISFYEDVIRSNKERVHSEAARPLMQIRRQRGEAPFGYFKMFGGLRRMAGRGLGYAEKKALMAALGWNLLLVVKSLMRGGPGASILGPIRVVVALVRAIWQAMNDLRARRVANALTNRRTLTSWAFTAKACLSAGC
jgi:transposase